MLTLLKACRTAISSLRSQKFSTRKNGGVFSQALKGLRKQRAPICVGRLVIRPPPPLPVFNAVPARVLLPKRQNKLQQVFEQQAPRPGSAVYAQENILNDPDLKHLELLL